MTEERLNELEKAAKRRMEGVGYYHVIDPQTVLDLIPLARVGLAAGKTQADAWDGAMAAGFSAQADDQVRDEFGRTAQDRQDFYDIMVKTDKGN